MNMKLWKKFGIRIRCITLNHCYDVVIRGWHRWCLDVLLIKGQTHHDHGYNDSAPLIKLGPGGDYTQEYFANDDNTRLVHREQQGDCQTMPAPVTKNNCLSNELQGCNLTDGRGGVVNFITHTFSTDNIRGGERKNRRRGLFSRGK